MINTRRILAALCGILLSLAASLAALTFLIDGLGGSAPLMHSLMERYAPASVTRLPAEHYPAMAEMITDYLSGREAEFQFAFTDAEGTAYQCFHGYEQQHMADCKALFDLDRLVLLCAVAALVLLGLLAWELRDQKKHTAGGFLGGTLLVLLVLTVAAVWAMVDFEGIFILFHRLSFTNDLWMLNPQTDLLIRLMPTAFFIHYAALLGGTWLGFLLLMAAAARYMSTRWNA